MSTESNSDLQNRAQRAAQRIAAIAIPHQEIARLAGLDRGTLTRALRADPRIGDRTWVKLERAFSECEEEMGLTGREGLDAPGLAESAVTATVEYGGATINLQGQPTSVAATIRLIFSGD